MALTIAPVHHLLETVWRKESLIAWTAEEPAQTLLRLGRGIEGGLADCASEVSLWKPDHSLMCLPCPCTLFSYFCSLAPHFIFLWFPFPFFIYFFLSLLLAFFSP